MIRVASRWVYRSGSAPPFICNSFKLIRFHLKWIVAISEKVVSNEHTAAMAYSRCFFFKYRAISYLFRLCFQFGSSSRISPNCRGCRYAWSPCVSLTCNGVDVRLYFMPIFGCCCSCCFCCHTSFFASKTISTDLWLFPGKSKKNKTENVPVCMRSHMHMRHFHLYVFTYGLVCPKEIIFHRWTSDTRTQTFRCCYSFVACWFCVERRAENI